ncbi:putative LRR receptor-like serine/threonine-protein kinase [Abeliophyllum distichum]|uniref:non-specific serine/threonine protein kinase n=1 Tax=Abeliophyllum distichum TaxID=126358 RepID=A0ABD1QJB7_9LAMI
MNLGNLQNLQIISLDYNQLTNDPSMLELDFLNSLINCRQLKMVRIIKNPFDGMLPRALGNLSASVEIFTAHSSGIKVVKFQIEGLLRTYLQIFFIGNSKLCGASQYKAMPCKGGTGSVYRGIFSDGMIAAIKVFNLDLEGANKSFDTECHILCNIRHRNLVKVITSCSNLDLKALVLEYMPNGNLNKWLSSSNNFLNIVQRLEIMIDVASALEYLHHGYPSPIVHCDLKPSNILLDEEMVANVADFGIAKLFNEDQRISLTKTLGTIGYMAPEYGSTGLISTMADVYSFGIMLMETFTKMKPTDDTFGDFTMMRWVFESFPNAITQIVDVDLMNVVENSVKAEESCFRSIMGLALECIADLPEERLTMKDVLKRLKKIKTEFC